MKSATATSHGRNFRVSAETSLLVVAAPVDIIADKIATDDGGIRKRIGGGVSKVFS
jgi:hypothetical protein